MCVWGGGGTARFFRILSLSLARSLSLSDFIYIDKHTQATRVYVLRNNAVMFCCQDVNGGEGRHHSVLFLGQRHHVNGGDGRHHSVLFLGQRHHVNGGGGWHMYSLSFPIDETMSAGQKCDAECVL